MPKYLGFIELKRTGEVSWIPGKYADDNPPTPVDLYYKGDEDVPAVFAIQNQKDLFHLYFYTGIKWEEVQKIVVQQLGEFYPKWHAELQNHKSKVVL